MDSCLFPHNSKQNHTRYGIPIYTVQYIYGIICRYGVGRYLRTPIYTVVNMGLYRYVHTSTWYTQYSHSYVTNAEYCTIDYPDVLVITRKKRG